VVILETALDDKTRIMQVEYRPATDDDLELMLAWRSHPELYNNFYEQNDPVEWKEHIKWWESRENRRDWIITVREESQDRWRDVGNVNVSSLDTELPEIGIYIGEITFWGEGVATEAIHFGINWLREQNYRVVRAQVLASNESSKHVFKKVGFDQVGKARENEYEFKMRLS
jgi:RimJ/RimL family protein N-acetyltransferase